MSNDNGNLDGPPSWQNVDFHIVSNEHTPASWIELGLDDNPYTKMFLAGLQHIMSHFLDEHAEQFVDDSRVVVHINPYMAHAAFLPQYAKFKMDMISEQGAWVFWFGIVVDTTVDFGEFNLVPLPMWKQAMESRDDSIFPPETLGLRLALEHEALVVWGWGDDQ